MIYTITPNPALDLGGSVSRIIPNEKTYVRNETRFPGGNSINAARILHRLGLKVTCTGFLGGGIGKEIELLLDREGIRHRFFQIQEDTRINLTLSNLSNHLQTRLSFPGPKISPTEREQFSQWVLSQLEPPLFLIGGSLPQNYSAIHLSSLIKKARQRNIRCILDVPGHVLKELISSSPLLIKPNLSEFQDLVGKSVKDPNKIIQEARAFHKQIPLIVVSSVDNGALLISPTEVFFARPPRIKVKSTVGAGDSMVGAMSGVLWKTLSRKKPPSPSFGPSLLNPLDSSCLKEILTWGLAAACGTLSHSGTELANKEQILKFRSKIQITQIR